MTTGQITCYKSGQFKNSQHTRLSRCHDNAVMSGLSQVEMSGTFQPPTRGGVMETGMSQEELQRVEVIALRRSGRLTKPKPPGGWG